MVHTFIQRLLKKWLHTFAILYHLTDISLIFLFWRLKFGDLKCLLGNKKKLKSPPNDRNRYIYVTTHLNVLSLSN